MAQVQEAIRGSRPDMSRNQSLAGQTVQQGKYEVTYNDNGYATKAVNTEKRAERQQNSGGGVSGELAGTAADPTGGFGDTYLGSSGRGNSSSRGGDSDYYESLQPTDLSGYLNDMYNAYTEAQLSALKSAYEQNLAGLQADAEKIPGIYQGARNEAASQNDIARIAFNEYANARGLNTGTSGQAALANSAALQSNLADISTQESDALAANALEQQQLAIQYRNAAVQAQAEGNYQLAQALYDEYVRQDNASMQTAQLAQDQANWEAQFNAGLSQWDQEFQAAQQQYQDSLAGQQREYAYNLAMTMLAAGVMPDANTLSQAGISTSDAMNMRLAASGGTSGGSRSGTGSGGGRTSSGGSASGSSQTQGENTLVEMNPDHYRALGMSLMAQLNAANPNTQQGKNNENAAIGNLQSRWDEMSEAQKQGMINLFRQYGIEVMP